MCRKMSVERADPLGERAGSEHMVLGIGSDKQRQPQLRIAGEQASTTPRRASHSV